MNSRVWIILENRCTGKSRAFETRELSWQEIQHNDNEIVVIDLKAHKTLLKEKDAELERIKAWAIKAKEALEKTSRADEHRPFDGRGGPEFVLSRREIAEISYKVLAEFPEEK